VKKTLRYLTILAFLTAIVVPASFADGGSGGGKHDIQPATKGTPPKSALKQWVLPMVKKENLNPILTFEETIVANPSMILSSIPLIGDLNGLRGVISEGPGKGGGIGGGDGTKVGAGGNGRVPGPGDGDGAPGIRGGFRGNITQPAIISKLEPEYSEEARKAKHQGSVLLQIVVDEHGQPRDIVVTQGLGLGLDERAVEAVKKWKFKPGTQNGKPVPMTAIVQVTFRLL